jgi:subtilisin family serine protease
VPDVRAADPAPAADGTFCAPRPDEPDSRVAAAVAALQASTSETRPVAVLDTGVDGKVPELGGRLVSPFDGLTGAPEADDFDGHGTQVASIAAGSQADTGLVRGISPASPIMPVRIFNRTGDTSMDALVAGIRWAVEHGASVINISSASPMSDAKAAEIAALTRAVTDAFNGGVLVVASAGNDGTALQTIPGDLPHVLTAGGSDLLGIRATFSNTGPWIDVVAPASRLVAPVGSAVCLTGYAVANGTSFAAPAVSAAAAMIAKVRPDLDSQQRFDLIRSSAQDVPPAGRDDETGFGLLNVQKALTLPDPGRDKSPEVDDDPFYVRGPNAATHPTLLRKGRTAKLAGRVSPAKDPSDVYPVRLKKGERFVASAKTTVADGVLFLALWKPGVGDFDVTNEVGKQQIVTSGGFSPTPELKMRVTKTGTYYVSVEASDAVDEDEPEATVPVSATYQLALSRKKLKTRPAAKKPKKQSTKRNGK